MQVFDKQVLSFTDYWNMIVAWLVSMVAKVQNFVIELKTSEVVIYLLLLALVVYLIRKEWRTSRFYRNRRAARENDRVVQEKVEDIIASALQSSVSAGLLTEKEIGPFVGRLSRSAGLRNVGRKLTGIARTTQTLLLARLLQKRANKKRKPEEFTPLPIPAVSTSTAKRSISRLEAVLRDAASRTRKVPM